MIKKLYGKITTDNATSVWVELSTLNDRSNPYDNDKEWLVADICTPICTSIAKAEALAQEFADKVGATIEWENE